jgi:hypothetical protein
MNSIDDILSKRQFWFFQLRESFMKQKVMKRWDPNCWDEYILLPVSYGFANNANCFFVSHYWRTPEHPDPDGVDLRMFIHYLGNEDWSYIWVDWTCMPQNPRTELQTNYFKKMLQCIPMVVRDCAFMWKYPEFEPRAWILYEVAEYVLNHSGPITADDPTDIMPFLRHVTEMTETSVESVLKKHGYKCTNQSDLRMLTGWLELLVVLKEVIPNGGHRQQVWDFINKSENGTFFNPFMDLEIDKVGGKVHHQGKVYRFTPVFSVGKQSNENKEDKDKKMPSKTTTRSQLNSDRKQEVSSTEPELIVIAHGEKAKCVIV